ncbi:Mitochondrial import inner membrane translocase subunit TIM50 [Hondaea fermentalgiana]|uniref:protein-serine/threonine phosphatase n=1 Tax=Hondaea fermentalgiana TaxID=2315210 RepID=A0A2R5GG26_9STRA|nr:Mitochondrial import inner membrane translocase subunit TIM50 [Hondaea fermentalgiana]|eukprot:GBG26804.1 Mitochondrial import inner membrane translocase subunit TIM50 [Hondaea fermentalgiana]
MRREVEDNSDAMDMDARSGQNQDQQQSAIATAGLITQTDASGRSMARSDGSSAITPDEMLRSARMSDRIALEHARNAQLQANQEAVSNSSCCGFCMSCLDICCCLGPSRKPQGPTLLPPQLPAMKGRKCLVLDLDETLVHSSFAPVPNPDYVLPVEIEGNVHHVYVLKRPGTDEFLQRLGKLYEIVVFTASLAKYASPLLDLLDSHNVIEHRLFREACTNHQGNYVKDLSLLGRDVKSTIIVDNSPASYLFHPENAIAVSSFIDDMSDRELYYALPFLEELASAHDMTARLRTYPQFIADQAALNKDAF